MTDLSVRVDDGLCDPHYQTIVAALDARRPIR
jgi:hypothetical protein